MSKEIWSWDELSRISKLPESRALGFGVEMGLLFGSLFWPELMEIDGHVFLRENFDESSYIQQKERMQGALLEQTINTTYLADILGSNSPLSSKPTPWEELGLQICECWVARANGCFPGRQFVANFAWYSEDSDPGVTLYQRGNGPGEAGRRGARGSHNPHNPNRG
jgi:hypothetical protein